MAIKIQTIGVEDDNVEITKIKALPMNDLPEKYLDGYPHCELIGPILVINVSLHTCVLLRVGDVIPRQDLEVKYLPVIRDAGNRLSKINQAIKNEGVVAKYDV